LTLKFIPQQLTPGVNVTGLRSLPEVGNLVGPLSKQCSTANTQFIRGYT